MSGKTDHSACIGTAGDFAADKAVFNGNDARCARADRIFRLCQNPARPFSGQGRIGNRATADDIIDAGIGITDDSAHVAVVLADDAVDYLAIFDDATDTRHTTDDAADTESNRLRACDIGSCDDDAADRSRLIGAGEYAVIGDDIWPVLVGADGVADGQVFHLPRDFGKEGAFQSGNFVSVAVKRCGKLDGRPIGELQIRSQFIGVGGIGGCHCRRKFLRCSNFENLRMQQSDRRKQSQ